MLLGVTLPPMPPKELPGFYWDEEKSRYFPESFKKRVKNEIKVPAKQEYSVFRRQTSFQIRMERAEFIELPFDGLVTTLKESNFVVASNFTAQIFSFEDDKFKLLREKSFICQIQAIHCTKDFIAVVFVPEDLDSPSLHMQVFDANFNLIEDVQILNYSFETLIVQPGPNEVVYINELGRLSDGRHINSQPRALFYHENFGTVVASTGGRITLFKDETKELKLTSSSARRIFYHRALHSLLLVTFHNQLSRLDLETFEQSVLVEEASESIEQCTFNEDYFYYFQYNTICFLNILNGSESFTVKAPACIKQIFIEQNRIFYMN